MDSLTPNERRPTPRSDEEPDGSGDRVPWRTERDGAAALATPTSKHAPRFELEPGTTLGEYRIEATIGQGGMGIVFAAVHGRIGKRVAIKVLKQELCTDPANVERFIDEARVVNTVGHPNIVDIFSFGEMQDGRVYFVMEYLKGETLRDRIGRAPLAIEEIVDVMTPLAHALEAAHAKGVIHRDLKPDNIFLVDVGDDAPDVKLLDFGIAKLARTDKRSDRTSTGTVLGTPQYMAPEQAKGYPIDHRADIYALGGIVFELLTGRPPFEADNTMEIVAKHLIQPPMRPSVLAPGLSRELDDLVLAMLAKDPPGRPSLAQVSEVLERQRDRAVAPLPSAGPEGPIASPNPLMFAELSGKMARVPPAGAAAGPSAAPADVIGSFDDDETLRSTNSSPRLPPVKSLVTTLVGAPGHRRTWRIAIGAALVVAAAIAAFALTSSLTGGDGAASPPAPPVSPPASPPAQVMAPAPGSTGLTQPSPVVGEPEPAIEMEPSPVVPPAPRKGSLRLVIDGAASPEILIDGARSAREVELAYGKHRVEVRAGGMFTQQLDVEIGKTAAVHRVTLVAKPVAKPGSTDDRTLIEPGSLTKSKP